VLGEEERRRQAREKEDGAEGGEAMWWQRGGGGGEGRRRRGIPAAPLLWILACFGGWTERGGRCEREVEGKRVCVTVYSLDGREEGEVEID
jgi:hypothetical protein